MSPRRNFHPPVAPERRPAGPGPHTPPAALPPPQAIPSPAGRNPPHPSPSSRSRHTIPRGECATTCPRRVACALRGRSSLDRPGTGDALVMWRTPVASSLHGDNPRMAIRSGVRHPNSAAVPWTASILAVSTPFDTVDGKWAGSRNPAHFSLSRSANIVTRPRLDPAGPGWTRLALAGPGWPRPSPLARRATESRRPFVP